MEPEIRDNAERPRRETRHRWQERLRRPRKARDAGWPFTAAWKTKHLDCDDLRADPPAG